jgi:hypothetical protein
MNWGTRVGVGAACGVFVCLAFQGGAAGADAIQAAIARGVEFVKKNEGYPREGHVGASALAGLTLLECGVPASDPAVEHLIEITRSASPGLTHTYSLALAIMFLDRLGDAGDVPLIQSMTVRLLAGQNSAGGWTYSCPAVSQDEINRLTNLLKQRNELRASRDVPKSTATARRQVELPREIQNQLLRMKQQAPAGVGHRLTPGGDNSNTQFAILGLWVGHRHGMPVEEALHLTETRFRQSQSADGGWGYTVSMGPTATMTCAGLLGLAMGYGSANEAALQSGPGDQDGKKAKAKKGVRDPGKDLAVRAGLHALGTAIGFPSAQTKQPVIVIPPGMGKRVYYFLWSLERVAVAYDLKTIGRKNWYAWGSEILLASQAANGSWEAEHGPLVDTCFALLFLRRANLAEDLTASLKGKVKDPGEVTLKAGGVGGEAMTGKGLAPAIDLSGPPARSQAKNSDNRPLPPTTAASQGPGTGKTVPSPGAITPLVPEQAPEKETVEAEAARLSGELIRVPAAQQEKMLEEFKNSKGVAYTQALATAIPKLPANSQAKARDALAERLMRMTGATLRDRLKDDDPEIRVAAARACAGKEDVSHVPDLIAALEDPEARVTRAAHTALKYLANGKDFGPTPGATPAERRRAIAEWKKWWKNQSRR